MKREQVKDLETIKEALKPTLMFIPRGLRDYTDHGISHSERIEEILSKIIELCNNSGIVNCKFNDTEEYLLYLTALVHDIGCIVQRKNHASISGEIIKKYFSEYEILEEIKPFLVQIVKAHSGKPEKTINRIPYKPILVEDEHVRIKYISAVFRLADACDIKIKKCPGLVFNILEPRMKIRSKRFWDGHRDIANLDFDIKNQRIIVNIADKNTTKIIIDNLKRNLNDVKIILKKYNFPFLKVETEVIDWID